MAELGMNRNSVGTRYQVVPKTELTETARQRKQYSTPPARELNIFIKYIPSKTHDACYSMQRGQATCDQEFCSNLKNSCDWTTRLFEPCQSNAWGFYQAVNWGGRSAYRQSTC